MFMITKDDLEKLIKDGKNVNECCSILEISKRELTRLRKKYGLNREYLKFQTICGFCSKPYEYLAIKEKDVYFCSVKCSVSIREKSEETKKKISDKLKQYFSKNKVKKHCLECNIDITHKRKKIKFCSKSCGAKHNMEYKKVKLSENRIKYLESSKHINWIDTYNINGDLIKVQGNWENEFALSMNKLGILYKRKSININERNKYTPDFYLPDYDMFVEVKGFLYEKDKYKMLKSIDYNKEIDLRIIFDINIIKNLKMDDFIYLERVVDIIKYEDIDFSKFDVRY